MTVTWNPNTEPDIAGYKIFYGTSSGAYTETIVINSPDQTFCEIAGLQEGFTYYFAAKAVDAAGQESDYSVEISKSDYHLFAAMLILWPWAQTHGKNGGVSMAIR